MKSSIHSNMGGPRDDHSKWNKQTETDRYHMMSLMCGIWNTIQMDLLTKQKQTHRNRKQTYGYQKGMGEG